MLSRAKAPRDTVDAQNRAERPVQPEYQPTLPEVIRIFCDQHAAREFLVSADERLTFEQVEKQSSELARGLLAAGLGKGSRVAILMPNCPDWVVSFFAAGRMGAFVIPVSTLFQPPEIAWLLKHADIETLLVASHHAEVDLLHRVLLAIPGLEGQSADRLRTESHPYLRRIVVWPSPENRNDPLPSWASRGPRDILANSAEVSLDILGAIESSIMPSDLLIGICTSGTATAPKLVMHTHGSTIRANHMFRANRALAADERDLSVMPMFWIGGLNTNLFPCLFEGACLVFPRSPRMNDLLATIRTERITRVRFSLGQRLSLMEKARRSGANLGGIKGLEDPRDGDGRVIPADRRPGALLGMTETFGPHGGQFSNSTCPAIPARSNGRSIEGIERRIVDPKTRSELPAGDVGELEVRGFTLMEGYYKRERREVFTPDGWYATGDLCRIDDGGYVFFQSRLNEMIKTAGANVAPAEVEAVLSRMSGVAEALVFGVPDSVRGEAVAAVVTVKTGEMLDIETLRTELRAQISSYKVPSEIFILEDGQIPRSASGKARKVVLKERIAELREGRFGK